MLNTVLPIFLSHQYHQPGRKKRLVEIPNQEHAGHGNLIEERKQDQSEQVPLPCSYWPWVRTFANSSRCEEIERDIEVMHKCMNRDREREFLDTFCFNHRARDESMKVSIK